MSKIKWFSGGKLGDEEFFEDDEIKVDTTNDWDPITTDIYMSINGFVIPIRMDMKFENLNNYSSVDYKGFTRDIIFVGKDRERNYELFIDLFDKFNWRLSSSLLIEKVDKLGNVLRRVILRGVRLRSRSNTSYNDGNRNYEVSITFDYWVDEYVR